MATRIYWTGPTGRVLDLLAPGDWIHSIAWAGLTGMVGQVSTTALTAVGVPGHTPVDHPIQPMLGELLLHVVPDGVRSVEEITAEIRGEFSQTTPGLFQMVRDHAASSLSVAARANGPIPPPVEILDDADYAELKIPIIGDAGLWKHSPLSAAGTVEVTNAGDAFCWPVLEWWGPATVVLPSGLAVPLPWMTGDGHRRVSTDPWTSHEITRVDGTVDEQLSAGSGRWPLAEGVPVGQRRTYTVTGDARLIWQLAVLEPWR